VSQSVQARSLDTIQPASEGTVAASARALLETTKPGITRLVTITSGVGFVMAAVLRRWDGPDLALTAAGALAGTALSASGANALNQWLERDRDGRMRRTASRPLPQQRLTAQAVLAWGIALCLLGLVILWALCGPVPAAVSLATILSYLFLYTPLKPFTPLATLVGAVPGALPPVIGWTAAAPVPGLASLGMPLAWMLFTIMFVWQIPHFLAIAWMYREDYAAGGYRVLPVVDPSGRRTSRSILAWSVALLAITVAPALAMDSAVASVYAALAAAMGLGFLWLTVRLVRTRDRGDARRTFIASIIHLPLLLVTLVSVSVLSRLL
jgi:protoheme IX farnesyltransferase